MYDLSGVIDEYKFFVISGERGAGKTFGIGNYLAGRQERGDAVHVYTNLLVEYYSKYWNFYSSNSLAHKPILNYVVFGERYRYSGGIDPFREVLARVARGEQVVFWVSHKLQRISLDVFAALVRIVKSNDNVKLILTYDEDDNQCNCRGFVELLSEEDCFYKHVTCRDNAFLPDALIGVCSAAS